MQTVTIKLKLCSYEIVYLCEQFKLFRVVDGKRTGKSHRADKDLEQIFTYLAQAEPETYEEIRGRYEEATAMDQKAV